MRQEGSNNGILSAVSAFLVGGLIGAVAGLLLAPKSGKETRQQIAGLAGEVKDKAGDYYEHVKTSVSNALQHGKGAVLEKKDRITHAVQAGIDAYEKKE
jgi:gas vesicle protein